MRNSGIGGNAFAFGLDGVEIEYRGSMSALVPGLFAMAMAVVGSTMISFCWNKNKKRVKKSPEESGSDFYKVPMACPDVDHNNTDGQMSMALFKRQPECPETDSVFQNEEPKEPRQGAQMDPNFKYRGSVENLNEDIDVERVRKNRAKGNIDYKYRNLGKFEDLGNIQPKNAYEDDGSNQALFDIVMVRLSLINEDFVHRSRYISGQPFGFTHDVLVVDNDDRWVEEEVDNYELGQAGRQGGAF